MQAEHDSLVLAYIPSDTWRPLLVYSSSTPVLMVKGKMSDFFFSKNANNTKSGSSEHSDDVIRRQHGY